MIDPIGLTDNMFLSLITPLNHGLWPCDPKSFGAIRRVPDWQSRVLYGKLKHRIVRVVRELCRQKGVDLFEGHSMPDHIDMCLSIPPKYSVAHTLGFLKGKSAVWIHRELLQERRLAQRDYPRRFGPKSELGADDGSLSFAL